MYTYIYLRETNITFDYLYTQYSFDIDHFVAEYQRFLSISPCTSHTLYIIMIIAIIAIIIMIIVILHFININMYPIV